MTAAMTIRFDDGTGPASLSGMLRGLRDVTAEQRAGVPAPGTLSGGLDLLVVLCGSSTAVTSAARVLRTWIESKTTVIHIEAGGTTVKVTGRNAAQELPRIQLLLEAELARGASAAGTVPRTGEAGRTDDAAAGGGQTARGAGARLGGAAGLGGEAGDDPS